MEIDKNYFKKDKEKPVKEVKEKKPKKTKENKKVNKENLKLLQEIISEDENILLKQNPSGLHYAMEKLTLEKSAQAGGFAEDVSRAFFQKQSFSSRAFSSVLILGLSLLSIILLIYFVSTGQDNIYVDVILGCAAVICVIPFIIYCVLIGKAKKDVAGEVYIITNKRVLFLNGKNRFEVKAEMLLTDIAEAIVTTGYTTSKQDFGDIEIILKYENVALTMYAIEDATFIAERLNQLLVDISN